MTRQYLHGINRGFKRAAATASRIIRLEEEGTKRTTTQVLKIILNNNNNNSESIRDDYMYSPE